MNKPLIAVTSGDPAGIGPEIVTRLFAEWSPSDTVAVVIGASAGLAHWERENRFDCPVVSSREELVGLVAGGEHAVVRLDTGVTASFPSGADSAGGGEHAGRAIETACQLATDGVVGAIVTAPISKKSLNLADFHYPGHTEMLARYLNAPDCQMMMVHEHLRVVPLTRHLPIKDVASAITEDLIVTCCTETVRGLRDTFGIASPTVAIAGLNPHAGDDGVIGTEDRDVIAPAIEALRESGISATGPLPADAMFQAAYEDINRDGKPRADAYIAMYHDQGLVPFKMLARRRGVNVTIGLPTIRTSVDHGVAYDIAGKGIAETESLLAAYSLAETLSRIDHHER